MDLVICLPKVQKNESDFTHLPGVLEGRNAIKVTWQQNLYRCLCQENWVETSTIKVIGNTIIPVLKMKTKGDTDKNIPIISLDISFEGPSHKGLEANKVISSIMQKYQILRPLVLVLKYLLTKKRLCESFTGGLSSYAVFLLAFRFLQTIEDENKSYNDHNADNNIDEDSIHLGDIGSIFLGFLKFYGDFFDPRTAGISVMRRCYFQRSPNSTAYEYIGVQQSPAESHPHSQNRHNAMYNSNITSSADRRHSFVNIDNNIIGHMNNNVTHHMHNNINTNLNPNVADQYQRNYSIINPSFEPYKFDPIFIEDPLDSNNNVGRNCFRILQVQKCFSEISNTIMNKLKQIMKDLQTGDIGNLSNTLLLDLILGSNYQESLL